MAAGSEGGFLEDSKNNKMKAVANYIKNSLEELNRVTWPTKNQAVRLTIIVLIFVFIVAMILGVLDYAFNLFYTFLLDLRA